MLVNMMSSAKQSNNHLTGSFSYFSPYNTLDIKYLLIHLHFSFTVDYILYRFLFLYYCLQKSFSLYIYLKTFSTGKAIFFLRIIDTHTDTDLINAFSFVFLLHFNSLTPCYYYDCNRIHTIELYFLFFHIQNIEFMRTLICKFVLFAIN